jgi:tRNA modification GTPase
MECETQQQRRQALRQMKGDLGRLYEQWRGELTHCLAHVEAIIDFSDAEEDVGESEILADILPRIHALMATMATYLTDGRRGEILRRGVHVAIVGAPNAGKSSLLNRLAKRDVAIVSPVAGTTRDVLEVSLNLSGYPFVVADTAGLRESTDIVEQEGIRRAWNRYVCDATRGECVVLWQEYIWRGLAFSFRSTDDSCTLMTVDP